MQKSIFDGVYFSKITSLHCADCNTTIYQFHYIYFLDHIQKLKMIFGTEVCQRLNKVAILRKRELALDLVEEALEILMHLQENLGKNFFSGKVAGLESAILLKSLQYNSNIWNIEWR